MRKNLFFQQARSIRTYGINARIADDSKYLIRQRSNLLIQKRWESSDNPDKKTTEGSGSNHSEGYSWKSLLSAFFAGGGVPLLALLVMLSKDKKQHNKEAILNQNKRLNEIDIEIESLTKDEIDLIPMPRLEFNRKEYDHSELIDKLKKFDKELDDSLKEIHSLHSLLTHKSENEDIVISGIGYQIARIKFLISVVEAIKFYKLRDYKKAEFSIEHAASIIDHFLNNDISSVEKLKNEHSVKFLRYLAYVKNIKCLIFRASNQTEEAIKVLLEALKVLPKHDTKEAVILHHLASAYSTQGNFDIALMMHCKVNALHENDPYFLNSLAFAYFQIGRYPEAYHFYTQAIRVMPHPVFLTNRAWLLLDAEYTGIKIPNVQNNISAANKDLESASKTEYKLVPYYMAIVKAYNRDYDQAISLLNTLKDIIVNLSVAQSDDRKDAAMSEAIDTTISDIKSLKSSWSSRKIKPIIENVIYPKIDLPSKKDDQTSFIFKGDINCSSLFKFSSVFKNYIKCTTTSGNSNSQVMHNESVEAEKDDWLTQRANFD